MHVFALMRKLDAMLRHPSILLSRSCHYLSFSIGEPHGASRGCCAKRRLRFASQSDAQFGEITILLQHMTAGQGGTRQGALNNLADD
jgi:hypothetical protein